VRRARSAPRRISPARRRRRTSRVGRAATQGLRAQHASSNTDLVGLSPHPLSSGLAVTADNPYGIVARRCATSALSHKAAAAIFDTAGQCTPTDALRRVVCAAARAAGSAQTIAARSVLRRRRSVNVRGARVTGLGDKKLDESRGLACAALQSSNRHTPIGSLPSGITLRCTGELAPAAARRDRRHPGPSGQRPARERERRAAKQRLERLLVIVLGAVTRARVTRRHVPSAPATMINMETVPTDNNWNAP